MEIELKIIDDRIGTQWPLPSYASDGAAGIDLRHCSANLIFIGAGEVQIIRTGIAIHVKDRRYAGLVLPRSGLGNRGLVLGNLVGLIDSDYQGEILISAWNRNSHALDFIEISPGDRIAQLVVVPVMEAHFKIVDQFGEGTPRGSGGLGSTGV